MTLLIHQIRNDCRHLRWPLALWLGLLLVQGLLLEAATLVADPLTQTLYKVLAVVVPMLRTLALLVIVPLLVQKDPLVGTAPDRLTRPISGEKLLLSKTVFALVFLVLPPLLLETILLSLNGVEPRDLALAAVEIFLTQSALVAFVGAVAAVTRNFATYAMGIVTAYALSAMVGLAVGFIQILFDPDAFLSLEYRNESLFRSREVVSWCVMVFFGSVVVNQYRTRVVRRSLKLAAAGALLYVGSSFFPWDFLKPEPGESIVDLSHVAVTLSAESIVASDNPARLPWQKASATVRGSLVCESLPPGAFCELERLEGTLKYPNGPDLAIASDGAGLGVDSDALGVALGGVRIVNPDLRFGSMAKLFELDEDLFTRWRHEPGVVRGEAALKVGQYVPRFELSVFWGLQIRARLAIARDRVRDAR